MNSEVVVGINGRQIPICVHPDNELLSNIVREKNRYSTADVLVFEKTLRPGGAFLDIGANIGWYSMVASSILGKDGMIWAIEPEPKNLKLLEINLKRVLTTPYKIFPVAVGESAGEAKMFLSPDNFGDHALVQAGEKMQTRESISVAVERLDILLTAEEFARIQLVKMDTQGFEPRILTSMEGLLKKHRPALMIEFSPSHIYDCASSPFEIFAFLEKQRYFPFRIDDDAQTPERAITPFSLDALFQQTKNLRNANYGIDLLLIPQEQLRA